tara:strand:+ start:742 stop:2409 length:1668 start_codon:yes stop_codon:yes gene_type:complete
MSVKKTIELEAKVDKAEKDLQGVAKSVQRIDDNLTEVKETTGGVAKGVKGISNAMKAAGIGLAIAAFSKLAEVFNENQKVTDAFSVAFESLSLAFNDFFNFLNNNIGTVTGYFKAIFDDPVQSIKNFGNAIFDGITSRLKQGLEALGLFGKAAIKFFSGDFAGAALTAKEASKELFDIVTGEDGGFDKIKEAVTGAVSSISEYTKSTIKAAQGTVELNKQAEVAAVINQGLIEKYDRQAEQQRQIRDDETKTMEQRIAANTELGRILDEQSEKMLQNVDLQIKAAQLEYDKNQNQENYIALLEAQNEREAVLAQIEGFRSEQLINRISLDREALELQKEAIETEDERIAKIAELTNFEILTAVEKLQRDRDNALAELDLLEATEAEKQKIKDHYADEEEKLTKLTTANKLDLASNAMGDLAGIFGEESKAGKAAAIAQTTIETYKGATSAFASLSGIPIVGPVLGGIAAAAAVAAGIANVKKITSIGPAVSGGGGSAPSVPQAPSFNVVGASETNQLAQTIGEQEDKPVKAFVVSNDVTNAQALDRNIVEGASIG